ncbi:MAG: type II toxin-antitoxin system HicA family toxin [Acidobacteria bacterium]|nr:type II toxin-antitoxin system HicA family toxin [Acidobacteriota bacterium]
MKNLGFELKRQTGSHAHFERNPGDGGIRRVVTVDMSKPEFWPELIRSMIRQSGQSREEFYGATKGTKKKL